MINNNKVFLDINGRCGNQMFQYAFARKLMIMNNISELHIDFFHVERWKIKTDGDETFSDQLKFFKTVPYYSDISDGNSILRYGSKKQKRMIKKYLFIRKIAPHIKFVNLLAKYQSKLHLNGIYKEDEVNIKIVNSEKKNIFARGYFENPDYFNDIRDVLINEFIPKNEKKEKNRALYSIIDNENSVCVSIRVWSNLPETEIERRNVCNETYYLKAIEEMHKMYPDAYFIIFSNDIEWVKKNFKFKYPVIFEDGEDEVWEKLRMMYSCKHFIMSTSTFCWWAQYLSRNKDKTVMCPKIWYADGSESKLICKNWLIID